MVTKGKFSKKNSISLTATQNNAIRINYIKAKIDNTQKNNKCMLCGDRDERINHIRNECSKLAQKLSKT